ncbi:hypothetical protein PS934_01480 [Pseudomonas fluorescens]|uniref:DUF1329 domain-containing protein n=1 Tax=Pseudomonas fluorescens TaxID=294 RepID=UPI00125A23B5|nr:DUF1329 domain-containing protein [Pseudomonas fluorescens]VVP89483.1 hypothetical protein PS934_01480 [Pseudomonas fluorescens]
MPSASPDAVLQTLGLAVGDRLYLKTTRNGVVLSRHPNPSLEELLAPLLENEEGHMFQEYQQGIATYAAITTYDFLEGRYVVGNLGNESKRGVDYTYHPSTTDFTPAALRNAGIR